MRGIAKAVAKAMAVGAFASVAAPVAFERLYRTEPREPVVWSPGYEDKVLLKNAEIINVLTGNIMHRRGLLISRGRIEGILTEKKAEEEQADKVLDADGMYVIPGLINGHCHMIMPVCMNFALDTLAALGRQVERNFEECITHGVTTVRDAGTAPLMLRRYMDRVESLDLLGPRVYSAGSFINAPGGYPSDYLKLPPFLANKWGNTVSLVKNPGEARDAVKCNIDWGSSFVKTAFDDRTLFVGQKPLNIMDDEQLEAMVDEAHSSGVKVSVHHRFKRSFDRALRFEVDVLDHVVIDEIISDEDAEAFASGGHYSIPTAMVAWALAGVSHGDLYLEDPLVQKSLANRLETVRSVYPSFCEPPVHRALMKYEKDYRDPSFTERRHLMYTLDPTIGTQGLVVGLQNVNKLYHAGATICCGNDGGIPQVAPGDLGREMVLLEMESDMGPLDVLRAATINNARLLGMEEELGSVDKGKLADLVLLSGNPLENVEVVLSPEAVFKEGKLLYTTHHMTV